MKTPIVHEHDAFWLVVIVLTVLMAAINDSVVGVGAALLGLWAAHFARKKGQPYLKWWAFGSLLAIVAVPYAAFVLKDKNDFVQQLAEEKAAVLKKAMQASAKAELEARRARVVDVS